MDDETQTTGVQDAPAQTADTAPAQTSEADVQVTEAAPEAATEVKDSEVNATDTAEERLYAGKYKTPEEMEKAYTELHSKFGQTASEKAELTRILNEAFMSDQPGQVEPTDEYVEETTPNQNDPVKRDLAVMKFMLAHDGADGAAMQKVLTTDPLVKDITGYEAKLEYAYLRSQNMTQSKAIAEAKKEASTQTQAKIVEKQTARVETAQQQNVQIDEATELRQKMSNGSPEEREAARRQYIRKYLV